MIFSSPAFPMPPRNARRAFTLVELLVVMAIIAIVIALVLPAIGGSRRAAQAADTKNLVTQLTNAISAFVNDEHKSPGYFTEREMGTAYNASTAGMSSMENIMLDLYGYQPSGAGVKVSPNGPSDPRALTIDPTLIGVPGQGSKQYFVPNKKYYVAQTMGTQQMGSAPHTSTEGDVNQLPDLIDTFGTPILAWRTDDTYIVKPGAANYKFALSDSGTGTNPALRARLYWASNACFLTATQTGKRAINQLNSTEGGMMNTTGTNSEKSLAGAFGSPNDPYRDPANLNAAPPYARTARASVIVQSAGADGYYFGKKDRGGMQFSGGFIDYRMSFVPDPTQLISPTNQYTDKDGRPTNHNVIEPFDDIIGTGGN